MTLNALTYLIHQFVLVILLVNVYKSYFVLKEKNVTLHRGGGVGGQRNVTKCHQGGGGGHYGQFSQIKRINGIYQNIKIKYFLIISRN